MFSVIFGKYFLFSWLKNFERLYLYTDREKQESFTIQTYFGFLLAFLVSENVFTF